MKRRRQGVWTWLRLNNYAGVCVTADGVCGGNPLAVCVCVYRVARTGINFLKLCGCNPLKMWRKSGQRLVWRFCRILLFRVYDGSFRQFPRCLCISWTSHPLPVRGKLHFFARLSNLTKLPRKCAEMDQKQRFAQPLARLTGRSHNLKGVFEGKQRAHLCGFRPRNQHFCTFVLTDP